MLKIKIELSRLTQEEAERGKVRAYLVRANW